MTEVDSSHDVRVVALAGGVGGAKLVAGLQAVLPPGALTIIVNTGDDFEHLGLTVCPDLDTVTYNLADLHDPTMGWGRRDETYRTLDVMSSLGGEDWFRLGDQDLALHLRRSKWLGRASSPHPQGNRSRAPPPPRSALDHLPMCDQPCVRSCTRTRATPLSALFRASTL